MARRFGYSSWVLAESAGRLPLCTLSASLASQQATIEASMQCLSTGRRVMCSVGNGRCRDLASFQSADIQSSISAGSVKTTGAAPLFATGSPSRWRARLGVAAGHRRSHAGRGGRATGRGDFWRKLRSSTAGNRPVPIPGPARGHRARRDRASAPTRRAAANRGGAAP